MSCSSPFRYQEVAEAADGNDQIFTLQGSYTLPSYTIPGVPICEPTLNCKWGGWQNTVLECSWGWCCCWSTPAIPVWPSITFAGSIGTTQSCEAEAKVSFTVDAPPSQVAVQEVIYDNNQLTFTVDDTTVPIDLPKIELDADSSGTFSAEVPITTLSSTYDADGITYTLEIELEFLFCLDPTPPQGWINIKLSCSLSCTIDGVEYEQEFDIACPIVSVEDSVED